jgi:hypothetical protein
MFNNKKKTIIILIAILGILIGLGFYLYPIIFPMPGIFTLNGIVRSVEGNSLIVLANVPETSSFSNEVPNYIEKEYKLNIGSDSNLFGNVIKNGGNYMSKLGSTADIKTNSLIDAVVKEDIMKNTELNVVELTVIQ